MLTVSQALGFLLILDAAWAASQMIRRRENRWTWIYLYGLILILYSIADLLEK